jgi:predicted metalloprotease
MITRILRLLSRRRRRASTKLTPRYEARRVRELRKAREMFTGAPAA